jgi:hypothetical protein
LLTNLTGKLTDSFPLDLIFYFVVPAKTGIHFDTPAAASWMPVFTGVTDFPSQLRDDYA